MSHVFWDTSGLVKRYAPEVGSDTVDALFAISPSVSMVATYLGYAETCATLRRKLNGGVINAAAFTVARSSLRQEVFGQPGILLLSLDDEAFLGSIALSDQHNLNSSDAAVLYAYLHYQRTLPSTATPCTLIATDQRLIRAAQAEGMRTLDPEHVQATEIARLLGVS